MSGAHSILPPSGAAAWRRCSLWVTMNQTYPQADTPESLEGNAAHWAVEQMLTGNMVAEGQIPPNGIVLTDEMIEGAELVLDTVRTRIPATTQINIESSVMIPSIHESCWGKPDVWAFIGDVMTLEVFDYKYGHRFVDEYENDQGIAYIAGLVDSIATSLGQGAGLIDQALKVNFTVIQPRCFHKGSSVRTWSVVASDLRAHINALRMAAELSLSANPIATTNSECRNCPGRHACPALQQAAYSDAEFSAQSFPVELNPQAASLELRMLERALERLQARVEGLQEAVVTYIRQGQSVPWHRCEQGFGRQQWSVPIEQVVAMGKLMNVDLSKSSVKTPKQALKAGIDESVIKGYTVTPLGAMKLVSDNPADARRVFGKTN